MNQLAGNDSDDDDDATDVEDDLKEINCTQDEFTNQRILPDLLSNQSIHLLDQTQSHEYRQAMSNLPQRTTSILTSPIQFNNQKDFYQNKRSSQIDVNVSPNLDDNNSVKANAPEIRKYKKRFNCDILCAALWGLSSSSSIERKALLLLLKRRQFVDWNRKWFDVIGSKWRRKSLFVNQRTKI